jgi:ribose/xylose/arabinose/galactoside ABC-type transport system permease subunit
MPKKLQLSLFLLDNLIWVIVAGFFLLNVFITPKFATYDNLVNILYHSAIMSLLVLAQGMVMIIGSLDLSTESILAFAPGIAILLATRRIAGIAHLDISAIIWNKRTTSFALSKSALTHDPPVQPRAY